jgi:hypothetical protein
MHAVDINGFHSVYFTCGLAIFFSKLLVSIEATLTLKKTKWSVKKYPS